MNGLTQLKDTEGIIYDVNYDIDTQMFTVWKPGTSNSLGVYFTSQSIKDCLSDNQIEIYKDGNHIFEKYLN